jgi:hypothetical protein
VWPLTDLTSDISSHVNELSHQLCPPLACSVQQGCPPLVCGSVHLSSFVQQQLQQVTVASRSCYDECGPA